MTFKKFGIGVKWVTTPNPEDFAAAIDEKTKAIFIESIANPKYIVIDIPALAKVKFFFDHYLIYADVIICHINRVKILAVG